MTTPVATPIATPVAPRVIPGHAAPTAPAEPPAPLGPPEPPTLWQATRYWLRLGCVSFGGPAGQIALMHEDLVVRRRWISNQRFLHALNYCMVLPGPEAQQLATYLGWLLHRSWGGVIAGGLFVLPSLVLLLALSWLYMAYGHVPVVAGVLYGVKPAVTALVVAAAWRMGQKTLHSAWLCTLAVAAFAAITWGGVAFPWIVLGAAALGYAGGRWWPKRFGAKPPSAHAAHAAGGAKASATAKADASAARAVIDDDTPTPAHARFSPRRLAATTALALGLWAAILGGLAWQWGWQGTPTQMAWFFTKAALLTFGGAYAVLPYVQQGAVSHFGWLSATQMMDGLALGESTPGPLIMVVTFVGFAGGWQHPFIAGLSPVASALVAGVVVTVCTFLPSFLFILAGGPLIESTHGKHGLTAPLTAITAAVVGVIANLATVFALHVFWPQGWGHGLDWVATALACAAAVALIRYRVGVMTVVLACAVCGAVVSQLR